MKKIIYIVGTVFLLGLASPAFAAVAFVQAASAQAPSTGGNNATTGSLSTTAGDLLVAQVTWNANGSGCGAKTTVISDSGGTNVWTSSGAAISQNFVCSQVFYAKNITGGSITISGNYSPSPTTSKAISVMEFSGLDTTSPLDVNNGKTISASPGTSAAFTTAQANEVIVLFEGDFRSGTKAYTAGLIGGVTATIPANATSPNGADGTNMITTGEYLVVSSVQTSITAAISMTGTVAGNLQVVSFKAASAVNTVVNPYCKLNQGKLSLTRGRLTIR